MTVAVIILNYNGEKLLPQFLPSVIKNSGQARIIVADNASTDSSLDVLKSQFPHIERIELKQNYGFCGGYNRAIALVDSDIIVLLNSDVEVTPQWLEAPVQLLETNSEIVAVQPKILSYNNKNQFEYAGAAGGYIDTLGYPFCKGRLFQSLEKDDGQYNENYPVFWATGACMIIRREQYISLGGLDEDFFAHMEEIDLCWRINRAGFKIYYTGQSTVYHLGGSTLQAGSARKVYYNFKNGLSLLVKNLPSGQLVYKFPLRIVLDWIAAFVFLIQGNPKAMTAVIKAHMKFLGGLSNDITKRKRWKPLGFELNKNLIFHKSILIEYFLKRKTVSPKM